MLISEYAVNRMGDAVADLAAGRRYTLKAGAVRAWAGRPGFVVAVERGLLWLTEEGGGPDVFVEAGRSWTLRRRGHVVVQALAPATFRWIGVG